MSLRTILVLVGAVLGLLILLLTCTSEKSLALQSTPSITPAAAFRPPSASLDPHAATRLAVMKLASTQDPNRPIRPLPPLGTPLSDVLPALKQQASEGDAAAACRIALELNRCAKLEFNRKGVRVLSAPGRAESQGKYRDLLVREVAESERSCAGLPDDELDWTLDYAMAAARAGNREARYQVIRGYAVGLDWFRPERTLEGWAWWRQEVAGLINAGMAEGDRRVMEQAIWAYSNASNGFRIFPRDEMRSMALKMTLVETSSPGSRRRQEDELDATIRHGGWDAAYVDQARTLARALPRPQPPRLDEGTPRLADGDPLACEGP